MPNQVVAQVVILALRPLYRDWGAFSVEKFNDNVDAQANTQF
jgi:hypothetical protein